MKCMLFSLMEGADNLIAEGFQPERDIWFAFGQDEEVSGRQGLSKLPIILNRKGYASVRFMTKEASLQLPVRQ